MFKLKQILIFLFVIGLLFYIFNFSVPLFIFTLVFLLGYVTYGSFRISSRIFVNSFCSNSKFPNGILLSFDDGPDPELSLEVLDILDEKKVKALFFVIGEKVSLNPGILKEIVNRGHSVGIHTFSHSTFFGFYSAKKVTDEIKKTGDVIFQATGISAQYFRPPFGITNPQIASAVDETGLKVVGWSVRSFDTKIRKGREILKKTLKKLKGGDIVLFHDTVKGTVDVLKSFIDMSRQKGFEFIEPEKFLAED